MIKKILGLCLAFAFIAPAIFLLSACGEAKVYYYTVETPENCTFYVNSVAMDKEGKPLVNKGDEFDGQVQITPGYEVSGELVIKVNGEVVEWTNTSEYDYYYFSFTPTEDFDIVIEGTIIESVYDVEFKLGEYTDYTDVSNLYIRFEGEAEQQVDEFLNSTNAIQNFKYNDSLKFYVYTKGYNVEPSLSVNGEFYKDEAKGEYGYVCETTIVEDLVIEFYGVIPVNIYFVADANGLNYFSSIDTELLKMFANENNIIITISENISAEVLSQLTLTINGEVQKNISFNTGENTITLKPAYEYISADGLEYSPYHYTIDLNFYDFDEFSDVFTELIS